ncbi:MAG: YlxR family protein [bacterium]
MTKKKQRNNPKEGEDKISSPSTLKRKCIACNELFERHQLIRIMREHSSKEIIVNPNNKTFGRSAYICNNDECFKIACKKNRFSKVLKINIDENTLKKIKNND